MDRANKFYSGGFLYNPKSREVLLHQRDGNTAFNPYKWAFFGGLNEGDEDPSECFIREVREELSLELSKGQLIKLTDYMNIELDTYRYVFYALSETPKSEMHLGEGASFDWIPISDIKSYDLTTKTAEDLALFLSAIGSRERSNNQ